MKYPYKNNLRLIITKRFTSGILSGECFNDQLRIKTKKDLDWIDRIGQTIDNYTVVNCAIYDDESNDYINRKQANFKLDGWG